MAEKKLAQIAVHVSEDVKCLIARLADAEGMTLSEVTSERMSELEAIRAAARRRGGKSGAESTNRKRQAKK